MIELIRKTREYLNYIGEHYNNVQKAWKIIQEKGNSDNIFPFLFLYDEYKFHTLDEQIKQHDKSTLSEEEFVQYRRYFYPTQFEKEWIPKDIIKSDFNKAWEHHIEFNPHHWENWTRPENKSMDTELHAVHMVCDWMAMGMKFNDTAKEYYEKNKDKIKLPDWAIKKIYEIFDLVY